MEVEIVKIEEDILIAGFSIEATLENKDQDINLLYNDFIENENMEMLTCITKNECEYYGIGWIPRIHEPNKPSVYKYLLGQKVNEKTDILDTKIIPQGEYAFIKIHPKNDLVKAWKKFYQEGFVGIGYKPKAENDIRFEYYSKGFDEAYELWILVEKM
jgi:DNA gyrase inhibitor GyrI